MFTIPEAPSTQIAAPTPYSEWFLDLETLLFGYLDPSGILLQVSEEAQGTYLEGRGTY